jgi:putative FmdB family regulatory protein
MPIYEYQCTACGHRFERLQRVSDPPETACAECGGPVTKLISTPAIQFKGSGFYITDYVKSGQTKEGKDGSTSAGAAAKDTSGSSSTTDAKPSSSEQGAAKPSKADTPSKPSPAKTSD